MYKQVFLAYEKIKKLSAIPNGKIFIRGASWYGRVLQYELESLGIKVTALLDNEFSILGGGYCRQMKFINTLAENILF
jgi:hypothetical protein